MKDIDLPPLHKVYVVQGMFNYTTDGDLRLNGMRVVKNMDDVLFFHSTLEGAIKELERLLEFCRKKNLKLKPSKFCIGEEVEFGGALITSDFISWDIMYPSHSPPGAYRFWTRVHPTGV